MSTQQSISTDGAQDFFRVHGFEQAVELLKDLSTHDQKRMLFNVMRKAVRPIPSDARANLGGYSQRVSKSLRVWTPRGGSKKDNPTLFIGVKSNWRGYGDPTDPWFAHIIEYGAEGVKKKSSHRGVAKDDEQSLFRIRSAQTQKGGRYRKDMRARPFWASAVARNQERVYRVLVDDISDELIKRVERKKKS